MSLESRPAGTGEILSTDFALDDNMQLRSSLLSSSSMSSLKSLPTSPSDAVRSSYDEGLSSGEGLNDAETTETGQLKDGTGLSKEEIQLLKSEVAFPQDQCHELRQQIIEQEEQLQQYEAEIQELELELGKNLFLEHKQRRSEKVLQSLRAHVSEQSTSCTESSAPHAFTTLKGKLLGGASPQQEPGMLDALFFLQMFASNMLIKQIV